MADLPRYEKWALLLTAGFVLFTGGWFLAGHSSPEPYTITAARPDGSVPLQPMGAGAMRRPPGQPAGGRNHRSEHRRPGGSGASAGHWPGQGGGHRRLPDGARPLSDGGPVDGGLRDRGGHPGGPASVYHSLRPGLTRPPTVFRTKGVSSYGKNIGRGRRARPGKGDHL